MAPVHGVKAFEVERLVYIGYSLLFDQEWAIFNSETKVIIGSEDERMRELKVKLEGEFLILTHTAQKDSLKINIRNHPFKLKPEN